MARKSRKNLPQPEPAAVSVLLPEPEEMRVPAAIYGRLSVEDDANGTKVVVVDLHYVGLTRAKDACYIMNGTARFRSKKNDYIFAEPSSFLSKPGLAERRKDVRWEM